MKYYDILCTTLYKQPTAASEVLLNESSPFVAAHTLIANI
jgi:hypothetical protein